VGNNEVSIDVGKDAFMIFLHIFVPPDSNTVKVILDYLSSILDEMLWNFGFRASSRLDIPQPINELSKGG
jgi:hypothetical protein